LSKADWDDALVETTTGFEGRWPIGVITPMDSFTPYYFFMRSSSEQIMLDNILIRDVWFVSGQSNMYESFRGFNNQPVNRAQEIILHNHVPNIRLFRIEEQSSINKWRQYFENTSLSFSDVQIAPFLYDYAQTSNRSISEKCG
jgi:sialate O-acetylesterase